MQSFGFKIMQSILPEVPLAITGPMMQVSAAFFWYEYSGQRLRVFGLGTAAEFYRMSFNLKHFFCP